ncbi:nuclease-related domain-containing protein [Jeotgalibaca sp. A122]|uniref:nuclease-related domain-containing protein n=1 Tax=Jeotgalibaca sp. A122 TaxID=3457322 RepID=UPI003FD32B59
MLMKVREKPIELQKLEALRGRMAFTSEQERLYKSLLIGYRGECLNDGMADDMDEYVMRLHDLLLVSGGRTCQIDSLFISDGKVYLLEIKNWEGSFDIKDGDFIGLAACPLAQLKRSKLILENVVRSMGIELEVEARLVFMNPKIVVYGIQRDAPILFVHQIPEYYRDICWRGGWSQWDRRLAERLLKYHVAVNPYQKEVPYSRASVSSGMMCPDCRGKMMGFDLVKLYCSRCNFYELKKDGLVRAKAELDTLFGNSLYPQRDLYLWCEGLVSKRMIHTFITQRSSKF